MSHIEDISPTWLCGVCGCKKTSESDFNQHMRRHSQDKPYQCEICHKRFMHRTSLYPHMKVHYGEKRFVCNICDKAFSQKSNLKVHERTHDSSHERTARKHGTSSSVKTEDNDEKVITSHVKIYQCHICLREFRHRTSLTNHIRTHTNERPFYCHLCTRRFNQRSNLNSHLSIHARNGDVVTKTEESTESLTILNSNLVDVKNEDSSETEESYETWSNSDVIVVAKQQDDIPEQPSWSEYKVKIEENDSSDDDGDDEDDDNETENFFEETFDDDNDVINEIVVVQPEAHNDDDIDIENGVKLENDEDNKTLFCSVCHLACHNLQHFADHIKMHDEVKPYECTICFKRFKYRTSLYPHKKIHLGDKRFVCEVCGKAFTQKSNLKTHERMHTIQRLSYSGGEISDTNVSK